MKRPRFSVQKHFASHLHYDLRLEAKGVLKSFALPKGPSLDPHEKRLAIEVDDHEISYLLFEGKIKEGYGAGSVTLWDKGTYTIDKESDPEKTLLKGLKEGKVHFTLQGKKLKGTFALVKLGKKEKEWLLIKKADSFASQKDILEI